MNRRIFLQRLGLFAAASFVPAVPDVVLQQEIVIEHSRDALISNIQITGTRVNGFRYTGIHREYHHMPSAEVVERIFQQDPDLTWQEFMEYDWYLVEPRPVLMPNRCVWCSRVLDHPYYTINPHNQVGEQDAYGSMAHEQHINHPVLLFPSKDGVESVPGHGVRFIGQISAAEGFVYIPISGYALIEVDSEGTIV